MVAATRLMPLERTLAPDVDEATPARDESRHLDEPDIPSGAEDHRPRVEEYDSTSKTMKRIAVR